jgi:predicted RNase H-like HicB family nuclease
VILQKEPEVGYHAFCPILKGCHSQGDSFEEAIDNITEAIELYIESLKAVLIVILSLRKISLYSN